MAASWGLETSGFDAITPPKIRAIHNLDGKNKFTFRQEALPNGIGLKVFWCKNPFPKSKRGDRIDTSLGL
jgi:hypothetical protein